MDGTAGDDLIDAWSRARECRRTSQVASVPDTVSRQTKARLLNHLAADVKPARLPRSTNQRFRQGMRVRDGAGGTPQNDLSAGGDYTQDFMECIPPQGRPFNDDSIDTAVREGNGFGSAGNTSGNWHSFFWPQCLHRAWIEIPGLGVPPFASDVKRNHAIFLVLIRSRSSRGTHSYCRCER